MSWIFSTTGIDFEIFFCFLIWRLLLLIEDVSESEVSLTAIVCFSLRNVGVNCLADGIDCGADGPVVSVWIGGAEIGNGGLKCGTCVKPGLFMNASSCLGCTGNIAGGGETGKSGSKNANIIRLLLVALYLFDAETFLSKPFL